MAPSYFLNPGQQRELPGGGADCRSPSCDSVDDLMATPITPASGADPADGRRAGPRTALPNAPADTLGDIADV